MAVSEKPWDGSPARWKTPDAYCAACLIDRSQGPSSKAMCSLPVREPGGALSRAACHAAAAALAGGRGGVSAPPDAKRAAARKLVGLYRSQLQEDPPESLVRLAGGS